MHSCNPFSEFPKIYSVRSFFPSAFCSFAKASNTSRLISFCSKISDTSKLLSLLRFLFDCIPDCTPDGHGTSPAALLSLAFLPNAALRRFAFVQAFVLGDPTARKFG